MTRILLSFLLVILLLFCFSQNRTGTGTLLPGYTVAEKKFIHAQLTSDKAGDNEILQAQADRIYLDARSDFMSLLPVADQEKNDSLGFLIRLRIAFIASYFDSTYTAKKYYLEALALKPHLNGIADSLLFSPYIYLGGILYSQNQFDSALLFYKKAEDINARYGKTLPGTERLYNRAGIMYYESGNYRQAGNYFEKAISLTDPADKTLLVNYKINIASLFIKLEEYEKAQHIYEGLIQSNEYANEIYHNLGIIHLKQQQFREAIRFFRKVNYPDSRKNIDLFYNYAIAWSGLQEKDSSAFYIEKALAENRKWNGSRKNIAYGLILAFQAAEQAEKNDLDRSAAFFQAAIIQFDQHFDDQNIFHNPSDFSGVYSYINLFNSLTAKAEVLHSLYTRSADLKFLQASLDAYRSAFDLATYVEKTYNSDEARSFIGKIKYTVHSKPIDISIRLYQLTQKKQYLEEAYLFDQQNKASLLSLNIGENELKKASKGNKDIRDEQSSIRSYITRLSLKLAQAADSGQINSIQASIRDYEIRLDKLEEKIKQDPYYRARYFTTSIPPVAEIQKKLDNKTALLSYHLSADEILVLLITDNAFTYYKTPLDSSFLTRIDSFKQSLYILPGNRSDPGNTYGSSLYQVFIMSLEPVLKSKKRLIIIPDDELNYLPFEALQDKNGRFLLQQFSITYLYSTALFEKKQTVIKAKGILAFAPFASRGFSDSSGIQLPALAASKEEVNDLKGKVMVDADATKKSFLVNANHYRIIHLATHAHADNEDPLRSFIAFYPLDEKDTVGYKLYAPEIYDMDLDSTELIILSACETGTGRLVRGEGLMSISRAFAYAGCPDIITSLWKAEDKTTAYITQHLHHYLEKGWTKDRALQQAKLDLLKDKNMDPRFKDPGYWGHLIFIGNYEPDHRNKSWWKIIVVIFSIALLYLFIKKARLK